MVILRCLTGLKPWFIQKSWLKMQIFPFLFFYNIIEKNALCIFCVCVFLCVFCHNYCTNHDSDLFSASKWTSEPQFCERFFFIVGTKMSRNGRNMAIYQMQNLWSISDLAKILRGLWVHFLSKLWNQLRFWPIKLFEMTTWTSVLWKILIQLEKNDQKWSHSSHL